jgi:hypothetical protein
MAQLLTETRAKYDGRRFEMTFVDGSGQKQTINLPVGILDMAAELEFGPALATQGEILSDEKKAKAYGFAGKDCDGAVKDLRDAGTKGIASDGARP